MEVIEKRLDEITPYENNPRHNADAVDKVAASLQEFGWQQPIVVDADGVIIAGHTRLKAAQKLGLETAPVVVAENLADEQAKAYRLADNKTAEFAGWDFDLLGSELLGIDNIDMTAFGFEQPKVALDPEEVEEGEADDQAEPRTKRGDIFRLGDHRLMCGDSTSTEDLDRLMNGELAKFVFTDPPYGVSIGSKNKTINEIEPGRGGAHPSRHRERHEDAGRALSDPGRCVYKPAGTLQR